MKPQPWDGRRLVVIESPFAGSGMWPLSVFRRWMNIRYARQCMKHSLLRGEAPIASHLLYTQPGILRDHEHLERKDGIEAGFAWAMHGHLRAFYIDRGDKSNGMLLALKEAGRLGQPIEYRSIYDPLDFPGRVW